MRAMDRIGSWEAVPEIVRGSRRYGLSPRCLKVRQRLGIGTLVRERQHRVMTLLAAQEAERVRRATGRAGWLPLVSIGEAFAADVARGSLPRYGATVREERRVRDTAKGDRHWLNLGTIEAKGWQVWQERLYLDHLSDWRVIESVMRQPGKGGATLLRAPSSVNAPSITASRRPRVADSHDARPAKERGAARPYSRHQFGRDVARGSTRGFDPSDEGRDTCRTIHVSTRRMRERGTAAALAAAVGGGRAWEAWEAPARERGSRGRAAAPTAAESRRARLAAMPAANGGNPDA